MMILTFKDSEETLLRRLIDRLGALEYHQVEIPTEPLLKIGNLNLYPLESRIEQDGTSYTLDRQRFQILYLLAINPAGLFRKPKSNQWSGRTQHRFRSKKFSDITSVSFGRFCWS